jgi:hypothetical protein
MSDDVPTPSFEERQMWNAFVQSCEKIALLASIVGSLLVARVGLAVALVATS